jgi:YVTN family beta-propeller protein
METPTNPLLSFNRLRKGFFLAAAIASSSTGFAQETNSVVTNAQLPQNTVVATVSVGYDPDGIVVSPDNTTVYVANESSGTISVIDATNNYAVKATTSVGLDPYFLAISPDGKTLYVSNNIESGTVSVIDTTQPTYPVIATLSVGTFPNGLAVTPDGTELYVANYGYAFRQIPGSISVFDTATNTLKATIDTGGSPWLILFTKKGKRADVLNYLGTGFIQFVNPVSQTLSHSTGGAGQIFFPDGMTSDASGSTLYITDEDNFVSVCNASTGEMTAQLSAVSSVYSAFELGQPAVSKNGKYLYVPYHYNLATETAANQVVMIDVTTGKIVGSPITVGYDPYWAQISPNGQTLYVANTYDGTVSVINITP